MIRRGIVIFGFWLQLCLPPTSFANAILDDYQEKVPMTSSGLRRLTDLSARRDRIPGTLLPVASMRERTALVYDPRVDPAAYRWIQRVRSHTADLSPIKLVQYAKDEAIRLFPEVIPEYGYRRLLGYHSFSEIVAGARGLHSDMYLGDARRLAAEAIFLINNRPSLSALGSTYAQVGGELAKIHWSSQKFRVGSPGALTSHVVTDPSPDLHSSFSEGLNFGVDDHKIYLYMAEGLSPDQRIPGASSAMWTIKSVERLDQRYLEFFRRHVPADKIFRIFRAARRRT